jgi:hypothetical protein
MLFLMIFSMLHLLAIPMSLVENKVALIENFNHKMPHLDKRKKTPLSFG